MINPNYNSKSWWNQPEPSLTPDNSEGKTLKKPKGSDKPEKIVLPKPKNPQVTGKPTKIEEPSLLPKEIKDNTRLER